MNVRSIVLLLLALPFAAQAGNQNRVWEGDIGGLPVVFEQSVDAQGKPSCEGRYFYRKHGLDITLNPAENEKACVMEEWRPRGEQPTSRWTMGAADATGWSGTWHGADGKTLPIHLKPLRSLPQPLEPSLAALRAQFSAYDYVRLSTFRLQPAKRETVQGKQVRWFTEPSNKITLFRIETGYTPTQRAAINQQLAREHWQWIHNAIECRSGNGGAEGFDNAEATIRSLNARVVSVSLLTSYYCGGAHPDFSDAGLNIEVATGRVLRLEDVLWLGKGAPVFEAPADASWNQAWADYRAQVFAPWVVKQMKKRYPNEMKPDPEGCDYNDPDIWHFADWYVTAKGIHLGATFPRVMRACDNPDWAVLPWSVVDAHRGRVRVH